MEGVRGGCRGQNPLPVRWEFGGEAPEKFFFNIYRGILIILYVNSNLILDIKRCVDLKSGLPDSGKQGIHSHNQKANVRGEVHKSYK